jgi:MoaA/NifB/PqqE/SkfB family radical SAM enzyme
MAFETGIGDMANPAMVKRALRQASQAGVQGIVWAGGGEPTTHPQWLDIVEHAASCGLQQGMYTLGGLLQRDTAHTLAHHATWVVVSMDCADAVTYHMEKGVPLDRFQAACDGVRWLAETGETTVGVSFLMHAGNWHRADDMLALARSLGASYTTFRPTIAEGSDQSVATSDRTWIDAALPTLERLAEEPDVECDPSRYVEYRDWSGRDYSTCYGIRLNATITPDGRVWVCPQRRGIAGSELGDLRQESFADIWARHPGQWTDLSDCRVMCRLHLVNRQLSSVFAPQVHEAFV